MKLSISFSKHVDGNIFWTFEVVDSEDFPSTHIFLESSDFCTPTSVCLESGSSYSATGCSPDVFEAKLDVNNVSKAIAELLAVWRELEVPADFELIL